MPSRRSTERPSLTKRAATWSIRAGGVGEGGGAAAPPTRAPPPGEGGQAGGGLGRQPDRTLPSIFLKSVSALVGPEDEIVMTDLLKDGYPSSHEAELAFIIG